MQHWEANVKSSIPNVETVDIKLPKKAQKCEAKEIYIACCLESLVLFNILFF